MTLHSAASAMNSQQPTAIPDWLRETNRSTGKKPSFQGPSTDANSNVIAMGWIEQLRRSKMQKAWKDVVLSLIKGQRPGEETTLWVQRETGIHSLETLQRIPVKWLRGVSPVDDYMGETRFSLTAHNLDDTEFIFRCKDAESTKKWVTTLQTVQQFVKGESSNYHATSAVQVAPPRKAVVPEKDLLNFDEVPTEQRLTSAEFSFVQQHHAQPQAPQQHAQHYAQHQQYQQQQHVHHQHQWKNPGIQQHHHWQASHAHYPQQPTQQHAHYQQQQQQQQQQPTHPHFQRPHAPLQSQWQKQSSMTPPLQRNAYHQPPPRSQPQYSHIHQKPVAPASHPAGFRSAPNSGPQYYHPSPPNSGGAVPPTKKAPPPSPKAQHSNATTSKYGAAAHPAAGAGRESIIKQQVVTQWALQPPQLLVLQPIDILVTTVSSIFILVPRHDYFTKWSAVSRSDLCTHHVLDREKLQKTVRKLRFFLHPDKLPKDLSSEQAFFCKLLWDIINDAWEEYKKK